MGNVLLYMLLGWTIFFFIMGMADYIFGKKSKKYKQQYFTKYLPVEGGFKRVVKSNGVPVDYEEEVKLFLCSNEIQVGDTVAHKDGRKIKVSGFNQVKNTKWKWKDIIIESAISDAPSIYLEDCFKIIGEIKLIDEKSLGEISF